jgi:branched-chain amino acid transport system permease protein
MLDFLATTVGPQFLQYLLIGLVTGLLYALVALGYTMVYGIIELINFAHGDLFMLGSFFALQMAMWIGAATAAGEATGHNAILGILVMLIAAPLFCATLNVAVDRVIYKPLREAPKLTSLVSAIGVSFIFMNAGVFWMGTFDKNFPALVPSTNLTPGAPVSVTYQHIMVPLITIPVMVALTLFVRYTALGKAMRATAQNPTAARLMGINVDRVISATFAIGGALAGVAAVVYGLFVNGVGYLMGFQTGLFAFTAAVLGGIGNIPGAVLGGILIGLIKSLGTAYVGDQWSQSLIFAILIVILIFRPNGILGARIREKV